MLQEIEMIAKKEHVDGGRRLSSRESVRNSFE